MSPLSSTTEVLLTLSWNLYKHTSEGKWYKEDKQQIGQYAYMTHVCKLKEKAGVGGEMILANSWKK